MQSQRRFIHIDLEKNPSLQAAFAGFQTGDQVTARVQFVVQSNEPNKGITGIITGCGEPEERPSVDGGSDYSPEPGKEDAAALVVLMKGKKPDAKKAAKPTETPAKPVPAGPTEDPLGMATGTILG